MTTETLFSLLRALLAAVGSYLIGHTIVGHTVDSNLWELVVGTVLALASLVSSVITKQTTPEKVQGAARAAWAATGGLLVALGSITDEMALSIAGVINAFLPVLQGHQARVTNDSISKGQVNVGSDGKIIKTSLILLLCLAGMGASAQSPFKGEPRLAYPSLHQRFKAGTATPKDSIVNAWRFTANFSPVGYSFGGNGQFTAMAGAEYGYQHQSYSYLTQKYTVLWSINAAWFPINAAQGIHGIKDIQTFGVTYGWKNNLYQVGPFYNPWGPSNQRFGIMGTIGILLN